MNHPSLLARIRAKVSRTVEPIAHGLLAWSRAVDARVGHVEVRVGRVESEIEPIQWGRDALVERLNEADAREESLIVRLSSIERALDDRLAVIEDRRDHADWAREAIVERLNFTDSRNEMRAMDVDARASSFDGRITDLERTIDEQATPTHASDLEALAMGRRLAALEDQLEMLLALLAGRDDAVSLISFPRPSEDDREKAAG